MYRIVHFINRFFNSPKGTAATADWRKTMSNPFEAFGRSFRSLGLLPYSIMSNCINLGVELLGGDVIAVEKTSAEISIQPDKLLQKEVVIESSSTSLSEKKVNRMSDGLKELLYVFVIAPVCLSLALSLVVVVLSLCGFTELLGGIPLSRLSPTFNPFGGVILCTIFVFSLSVIIWIVLEH